MFKLDSLTQHNPIPIDENFLKKYDFIITLGAFAKNIKSDICIHPFLDVSTNLYIRYEAGTEEGVAALFLYEFYNGVKLRNYINELDYGYLTSETNISEEEMLHLKGLLSQRRNPLLLIGSDFYIHPRNENIINIFSNLLNHSKLNIVLLSKDNNMAYNINTTNIALEPIGNLPENNGCIIYVDYRLENEAILKISNEFARVWKVKNNDIIKIKFDDFDILVKCRLDDKFGGVIGILNYTKDIDCGYRYKQVIITNKSN
ncbi:hypothetical protein CCY99_01965 [Helicobacter sp. 16-1353]|uniref:hypothetical protein n=1 Tax=Helicobacter sp. 16-1353 TaxID=2004996 RepID=UPI000DCD1819|nr:hypothetical protein [Helicobacter sp. 16-1353]RAX54933.1 hypothetical protein CCY99_01965 [Helicobacter sp. 16-1353]